MNNNNGSIYLMVGDLYFGDDAREVRTLLGSCVAVTLWHPRPKHGGMCHIILPEADMAGEGKSGLDTRYAGGAIETFLKAMQPYGCRPNQYHVGLFGGGQMFMTRDIEYKQDVGLRNIEMARRLLDLHGFRIDHEDVSGPMYRHVSLNLQTGDVDVRATPVEQTMG